MWRHAHLVGTQSTLWRHSQPCVGTVPLWRHSHLVETRPPPGLICLKYNFSHDQICTAQFYHRDNKVPLPVYQLARMSSFVVVSSLEAPTSVGLLVPANFNQLRDCHSLHTFRSKFCLAMSRVSVSKLR